jgi:hypothetical protein
MGRQVYLADVADHMDDVLSSLELFSGIAQSLVDFTFQVEKIHLCSRIRIIFLTGEARTAHLHQHERLDENTVSHLGRLFATYFSNG